MCNLIWILVALIVVLGIYFAVTNQNILYGIEKAAISNGYISEEQANEWIKMGDDAF